MLGANFCSMRIEIDAPQEVSTGSLPRWADVDREVLAAHERYTSHAVGAVADYIPVLGRADPELFGIAVVDTAGGTHTVGAADVEFSIQSISKALVYAYVSQELGHAVVSDRIGVNNTGLGFNSVMAIELNDGNPRNPMVNAGAMAATALVPGSTPAEQWETVRTVLSEFAGRQLTLDGEVYHSEMQTNYRNRAIAQLLQSYGRIDVDPADVVDVYTRQCSLRVTARDLAVMAATLADGGVNPLSGRRVVTAESCRDTLAVLAATGMYECSGEWLFEIGIPAKSGVSGGILAVAPGKGGIATFSPPLDDAGNSVRGQRAIKYLSRTLGLNIFASAVHRTETTA